MTGEALACFTSLVEDVPGWIADLEGILKSAGERQVEMLFDKRSAGPTPTSSHRNAKSKTSSMRSWRSRDRDGGLNTSQHPQMKHATGSDALRLFQRKRKTASACSGEHSGPVKLRAKAAVVVYYDGESQKQFEKIVRTVASSRNSIRKGKMAAKVDSLARLESSYSDLSSGSDDEDDEGTFSPTPFRLDIKSTSTPRLPLRKDDTETFDKVDSILEKGQSACERAAHQVLREGDCTAEVNNAKEYFRQALKLSEAEVPLLRKEAEKAAAAQIRREERRLAELEAEDKRKSVSQASEKIINVIARTFSNEGALNVDELEVDDDSDDGEAGEFNIGAIRGNIGTFSRMRRSRLTAH